MKRLRGPAWIGILALAIGATAGVTILSAYRGTDTVVAVTLGFTILAAIAAALGTFITWRGNLADERHQQRLSENQIRMAEDIRLLAEVTETSLEEARAQRPKPVVHFLVGEDREPADAVVVTRERLERPLDVERIVAGERERALATIPNPKPPPAQTPLPDTFSALSRIAEQFSSISIVGPRTGPITEHERAEFGEEVDEYEREDLRAWLSKYQEWRGEIDLIFRSDLQFENVGRVPARGVRVQLRFADSFQGIDDYPQLDSLPARPRFKRRSPLDFGALYTPRLAPLDFHDLNLPSSVRSNVSGPRYRRGSLLVEYKVEKILHGLPEETSEPVLLRAEQDGDYEVPWEIHAENLPEATRGTLRLRVVTRIDDEPPITSLDEIAPKKSELDTEDPGDESPA